MTNLQKPYALVNKKVPVSPEVSEKGKDFSCPICKSDVVLRRGDVRQAHFVHKPDKGCSGEGLDHMVAKQIYIKSDIFIKIIITFSPKVSPLISKCVTWSKLKVTSSNSTQFIRIISLYYNRF